MTSFAKLVLISTKPREQIVPRNSVKECYCCLDISKTNRILSKTEGKTAPFCYQCRNQSELKPIEKTGDNAALTSKISCEIIRRVKEINYTPKSQFLCNVQNRICDWQNRGQGDRFQTCPRSSCYHKITSARLQDINLDQEIMQTNEIKCIKEQKSSSIPKESPVNVSIASKFSRNNIGCMSSKEIRLSLRKRPKLMLKKATPSRKVSSRLSTQDEQISEHDCCKDELGKVPRLVGDTYEKKYLSEHHERRIRHTYPKCDAVSVVDKALTDDIIDQEIKDLGKFRKQNFFETHGSSHTLTSRLLGSFEQYLLNERLFPDSVGKIHRQHVVITMPPCATTEKKRIHYFSTHVVRQEKGVYNMNYRWKRHQSCPLTGHAIDLGILKARLPLNSLALKYQKKII